MTNTTSTPLAPLFHDRFRRLGAGWLARLTLPRRLVAALLALLAVGLALFPPATASEAAATTLVTARDLAPGQTLTRDDVRPVAMPTHLVPAGALTEPATAVGRVLAGAARAGEPLTDARLVGADSALPSGADPNAVAVAVRLADPAVADLLHPGSRVDVVAGDSVGTAGEILADGATVVTVRPVDRSERDHGQLVVLAVARDDSAAVAGASLQHPVTVTLR
ncbi:SAF domain-containing protein [Goodfellowiella coeruleoviolacea]|uniref:Flp pilus assembly protein CpaB n=1 Tax=Goodfellowiella coeruleoviolacea TaxID=334858 RepID=A0AAE3KJ69_9PSEU|nr:SAF domain-containing protein [Goodfellowiella coeruleoviolacea]MCP2168712.1 Flp pilus assembly protein CpaB [Goodfellowiella coeruleoviolacea]